MAEPDAMQEILTLCARLPLALATVAGRAAVRPGIALAVVAAELREAGHRLDALACRDPMTNVRSVFSWSYHTLSADVARLFRLSAVHRGPVLTIHAAASITGTPLPQTRRMLAELADSNLVTEYAAGRYTIHDLLRAYAMELADSTDSHADRAAALHRILDYYLHTAHAAASLLEPNRERVALPEPRPDVAQVVLHDAAEALSWLDTEHAALVAVVRQAADAGFAVHTWQLAHVLNTFFSRRGHWHDQLATQHIALNIARCMSDRTGEAHAHSGLARAYLRLARYDRADDHLHQALDLYRELDDPVGQARSLGSLAFALTRRGHYQDSLPYLQHARELFGANGHTSGYAIPSTTSAGATPYSATSTRLSPTAGRLSTCWKVSATSTAKPIPTTASVMPTTI